MKKKNVFIDWSYGEGETTGSYNTEVIGAMSENDFVKSEQFAHYFPGHSPAAREIRMKALYQAVSDKNASAKVAPAPAAAPAEAEATAKKK
jgi:hypothetical protein